MPNTLPKSHLRLCKTVCWSITSVKGGTKPITLVKSPLFHSHLTYSDLPYCSFLKQIFYTKVLCGFFPLAETKRAISLLPLDSHGVRRFFPPLQQLALRRGWRWWPASKAEGRRDGGDEYRNDDGRLTDLRRLASREDGALEMMRDQKASLVYRIEAVVDRTTSVERLIEAFSTVILANPSATILITEAVVDQTISVERLTEAYSKHYSPTLPIVCGSPSPFVVPPSSFSPRLRGRCRTASVAVVGSPPLLLPREDSLISRDSCDLVPLSLRCRGSSPPAFIATTSVVVASLVSPLLPSLVLPSHCLHFVNEASTSISF
ncbi:hypothetical protein LR48_Vigan10g088000 [Vigna angularis]|uniref:Uncharacterized protein n=1 Tax=Phaseolus angularis TaxID=3914 RepID=A0A0L9VJ47_PHAAN|nr:hypothetical protein LR48_Vigan10g088000 [Vigna angularis]